MDFKEYQDKAKETAIFPKMEPKWLYPAFGLGGEVGEVMEKLKKILRDFDGSITEEKKDDLKKEIGDVLWYLTMLSTELNFSLDEIAIKNLEKLKSRMDRGTLHGSGDNR